MRRPKFIIVLLAIAIAATIVLWPSRLPVSPQSNPSVTPQPPPAPKLVDAGRVGHLHPIVRESVGYDNRLVGAADAAEVVLHSEDDRVGPR